MRDVHVAQSTYICDHFAPGLVPLPVVCPLLFLLQDALSGGAVLQGKFTQDFAKAVDADLTNAVDGMTQEEQECMEP